MVPLVAALEDTGMNKLQPPCCGQNFTTEAFLMGGTAAKGVCSICGKRWQVKSSTQRTNVGVYHEAKWTPIIA
jgi:transcription elongation factor Elf1